MVQLLRARLFFSSGTMVKVAEVTAATLLVVAVAASFSGIAAIKAEGTASVKCVRIVDSTRRALRARRAVVLNRYRRIWRQSAPHVATRRST